jgi:hypothetical protein
MVCTAARDIRRGEQLFVSYCDPRAPYAERAAHLMAAYDMVCDCAKCLARK